MDVAADFQTFQQTPPDAIKDIKARKEKEEAMEKRDKKLLEERQFKAADKLVEATKEQDKKNKFDAEMDGRVNAIRKIRSYVKAFPEALKDFKLTDAKESKMTLVELNTHLKDVEYHLGKRGGADLLASTFKEGIKNLEWINNIVKNPFDLDLRNIDKVADAHMETTFDPLFKEIVCKYEDLFSVRVEVRFVVAVVQLIMAVNRTNKMDKLLKQPMNRKTPDDLNTRINKI